MSKAAAIAFCVAALVGGASPAPAPARSVGSAGGTQCRADERVVYSCQFGRKLGSVCLGETNLHYRFGPKGQPELDLASTPDWSNIHIGSNRSQGGLNQNHIRFTTFDTHYVVHAGETGQLNERPGVRSSGIAVLKGSSAEDQIASFDCKSGKPFGVVYYDLEKYAPEGWDGWEPDDGPFDVIY